MCILCVLLEMSLTYLSFVSCKPDQMIHFDPFKNQSKECDKYHHVYFPPLAFRSTKWHSHWWFSKHKNKNVLNNHIVWVSFGISNLADKNNCKWNEIRIRLCRRMFAYFYSYGSVWMSTVSTENDLQQKKNQI